VSVCEAIDASAACCGVGNVEEEEDVEPSFGEDGGVGYMEDDMGLCLRLRRDERDGEGLLRMFVAEEK